MKPIGLIPAMCLVLTQALAQTTDAGDVDADSDGNGQKEIPAGSRPLQPRETGAASRTPPRFTPSEKIRADDAVPFPVDI